MDEAGFAARMRELCREAHSANVRRGRQRKVEQGGLPGCAPVGYVNRRQGDRSWVEVDPVKGPLVREAFELMATGDYSLRQLLRIMTEKGLVSRRGNGMSVSVFAAILSNRFYAGTVLSRGRPVKGVHVPLVSAMTLAAVRRAMAARRKNWQ